MWMVLSYMVFGDSLALIRGYLQGSDKVDTVQVTTKSLEPILKKHKLPPFIRKKIVFYRGKNTVLIDDIKGKHKPITYMVVIDETGKVKAVEILVYREKYGWEIGKKDFLSQFRGKGSDDMNPGKTIRNIPGATISVNSISTGVRRALVVYKYIFGK